MKRWMKRWMNMRRRTKYKKNKKNYKKEKKRVGKKKTKKKEMDDKTKVWTLRKRKSKRNLMKKSTQSQRKPQREKLERMRRINTLHVSPKNTHSQNKPKPGSTRRVDLFDIQEIQSQQLTPKRKSLPKKTALKKSKTTNAQNEIPRLKSRAIFPFRITKNALNNVHLKRFEWDLQTMNEKKFVTNLNFQWKLMSNST